MKPLSLRRIYWKLLGGVYQRGLIAKNPGDKCRRLLLTQIIIFLKSATNADVFSDISPIYNMWIRLIQSYRKFLNLLIPTTAMEDRE